MTNNFSEERMTKSELKNLRNKLINASVPPNLANSCAWGFSCKINLSTSNDLDWSDKLSESNLVVILTMATGMAAGIEEGR